MANMKEKELKEIEVILADLLNGNIYKPVEIVGTGEFRLCLKRIEELRIKLINLNDEKISIVKDNQTSMASIIHDLKTPLAVISGYAECLQDKLDDKDYPKLIADKTEQMNNLVLNLLELSKEKIVQNSSDMKSEDSLEFFEGVCDRLPSMVDSKKDRLIISKIPSKQIRISPYQIGRVIQNIVSNAVKYSDFGSTIKMSFSANSSWFTIEIKDNGYGISKEDLPHIFEQLYKADKSRTDLESNGLGLYASKEIIEAHGGTISAKSKVGKGSVFKIMLPVEQLDRDKPFTERFNSLPKKSKVLIVFLTGFIFGSIYRFIRYAENKKVVSIVGGFVSIYLMPFMWIIDIISIIAHGRFVLMAD